METEPFRIDKNVMNRLRMHVAQKAAGRVYGEIGATVERAINEYLYKEENCHKMILTKRMNNFSQYVHVISSDTSYGRVVMLTPVFKDHHGVKEDSILIRAASNKIKLRILEGNEEIKDETEIQFFVENENLTGGLMEFVSDCLYEELKNGIIIMKEVRIPVHKALSIRVPSYVNKEIHAENIMFEVDLCPGKANV